MKIPLNNNVTIGLRPNSSEKVYEINAKNNIIDISCVLFKNIFFLKKI